MSFWDKASQIASSSLKTIRLTGNNEEQNSIKNENEELKNENERLKNELNDIQRKYKQLLDDITLKENEDDTTSTNTVNGDDTTNTTTHAKNNESNIYHQMYNNLLYNFQQYLLTLFTDNESITEKIKKDFYTISTSSSHETLTTFCSSYFSLIHPKILYNFHTHCKSKYELCLNQDILNKLSSYSTSFTTSESALSLSTEVIDSFLSLITTYTNDISSKDAQIKKYEDKFTSLNDSISKMQSDCRRASAVEQNMEEIITSIQNEKNEMKIYLDKANKDVMTLEKANEQLLKAQDDYESSLSKLNDDIIKETKLKEEVLTKITEYVKENDDLKSEIAQLKKDIELYNINNESLNEKNAEILYKDEQIEKMKSSYKFLEDTYLKYQKDKNDEINLYKTQILELSNQLTVNKEIDNINQQKEEYEKTYIDKIEQLNNQIDVLEKENVMMKEKEMQIKKKTNDLIKKVENDLKDTEYMIDKRIISSVLVSYFDKNTSAKVKESLLETLSGFMEYGNEDRKKMGLKPIAIPSSSLNNNGNSNTSNTNHNDKLKTLSDGLYDFILNS
jgi:chromosome segregation ATPase